eukprot:gnl/TRDRNA2_/TRDRNA2_148349_c3_seq3.p3 gnl/TRDRNA2_/TRDRNA2_148349_c3~~gnl/TRDRNA2_/TRDRNA2_148349_c3_seq3.p3  ORF type:complete len:248 (+),score=34.13 gnl/TRDRNA2_/TRDRNA2_148349_c3_seq3:641-1384(+)
MAGRRARSRRRPVWSAAQLQVGVVASSGTDFDALGTFDPLGSLVFMGTACFSFEGIGLLLPMYDSARYPESFPVVFSLVFGLITTMIACVGLFGYMAFEEQTEVLVLENFSPGLLKVGIQLAFAVQMIATFPLQLLPALRLTEALVFAPMSNPPFERKCRKNIFRAGYVALLCLISIGGATSLDHFISIVGALCGVPLAYVFPAVCHYKIVSGDVRSARVVDLLLIVIGSAATLVVTCINVMLWRAG